LNKHDRGALLTVSVLLTLSANVRAQHLPPDVIVSNPREYEGTITTKFIVPRSLSAGWHPLKPNRA
jgi:hypothetical protein